MAQWIRDVFSAESCASFGRVLACVFGLSACVWISGVVWWTHALPDPVRLAALTAFVTAPYMTTKVAQVMGKK